MVRKSKKVFVEKDEIYEIYCNMCGNIIKKDDSGRFYEYLAVDKRWDYLSIIDGENHSFDLCDLCYKNIIEQFKIKVIDEN